MRFLNATLSWSIHFNLPNIAKMALHLGADPNVSTKTFMNPFPATCPPIADAANKSRLEIVKALLAHPRINREDVKKALLNAVTADVRYFKPKSHKVTGEVTMADHKEIVTRLFDFLGTDLFPGPNQMNVLHWAAKVGYLDVVKRVFRTCSDTLLLKLLQAKGDGDLTPSGFLGYYHTWGGPSDVATIKYMFDTKLAQISADVAARYHLDDERVFPNQVQAKHILNSYGIVLPLTSSLSEKAAERQTQEIPTVDKIKRGF